MLVVDAARVPGETWQEERGIIWEPASLGWVTHEGTAQGWLHWSAKGSRKQKSWEGNWAAHSGRGSGAAWPPRSSKFMLVGPRSQEGRWEGRGAAGLLATVCAPPSRDLQTSESTGQHSSREAGQDCKSGEFNSFAARAGREVE